MIGAVWMQVRAELRARRRATIALALLIGLGGGSVIAAAAGARRTDTAYARLVDATSASHAVVAAGFGADPFELDEVLAMPEVAAARRVRIYLMARGPLETCGEECLVVGIAYGPEAGGAVDVGKVVAGRRPDPSDPSEVALTVIGDENTPLEIGGRLPLSGVPFGEPFFERFAAAVAERPLELEVVGVVALPQDFPPQLGDETVHLQMTPAFLHRYDVAAFGIDEAVAVRLRSERDIGAFKNRILRQDRRDVLVFDRVSHGANVQRSMHLQALTLWLLAAFAGVAILLIASQAIVREAWFGADDHSILAALGMRRGALVVVSAFRVLMTGLIAACAGVATALALSPVTPIGLARTAEPAPGFAADAAVIGIGAASLFVLPVALAVIPMLRVSRLASAGRNDEGRGVSVAAEVAGRAGLPPASLVGMRMALEPGRGRTAVPVRTTIATVTIGIAALVASLAFGGSLDRLVSDPRLYGVPWDLSIQSEGAIDFATETDALLAMPEVEGLAIGPAFGFGLFAGDEEVEGIALDPVSGAVAPPILEGRAPVPGERLEVVLGSATMRRLGVAIGTAFSFRVPDIGGLTATVVGRGVIPTGDDVTAIGDAAWFSFEGLLRAVKIPPGSPDARAGRVFLDLGPGVDPDVVVAKVSDRYGVGVEDDLYLPPVGTPGDLVSFGRVRNLPFVVAGLLALIAAGALAHTLTTAIRRRRREVAVLKALGFSTGQARRAIAVQATVVTTLAALVGVPVGVAGGRWAWTAFAEGQGVVVQPVTPWGALAILVPAALLLANVIAALPARAAARTRPAAILRTE